MDLRDYLRVLWRRRVTIGLVTLVVTAAAIGAALLSSDETTSRAVAAAPAIRADGVIVATPADVALEREIEVARSDEVIERAASETGESAEDLRVLVSIAPADATSRGTIAFSVTDSDPARAAELANATASAYVSIANEQLLADLGRYRDAVQAGSAQATEDTLEFLESLGDTALDVSELSVGRGATALDARLADLAALMDMESSHAQLLSPAGEGTPDGGLGRNTVLGITLGLFLGVAGALVQEQLDDRLRRVETVHQAAPDVPVFDGSDDAPHSLADAVRLLGIALDRDAGAGHRAVAVTAPGHPEHSSRVAADLARTFAERGRTTAVLSWGTGAGPIAQYLTAMPTLQVAEPVTASASPEARARVEDLRSGAQFVVIDAAPVLAGSETGDLAGVADAAVLVVGIGVTRAAQLRESVALLGEVGIALRAIVIVGRSA